MIKYIVFTLFTVVLSMNAKAIECNGRISDGERRVPFTIYVVDQEGNPISGARVRIRTRTETVEGFSNSKGLVTVSPSLRTYAFWDIKNPESEELPEDCRNYHGFNTHSKDYLIVQKEGFHSVNIILGMLKFESRFYNNEELKTELSFFLLSSDI